MTTSEVGLSIDSKSNKKVPLSQRFSEFAFRHRSLFAAFLGATFTVSLLVWAFQSWSRITPLPIDIFPQSIEVMRFSDDRAEIKAAFSTYNKDQNASTENCQMDLRANLRRVYRAKETYYIGRGVYRGTATFDVLGLDATPFNADYEIRIKCYGQETLWLSAPNGIIGFKDPK